MFRAWPYLALGALCVVYLLLAVMFAVPGSRVVPAAAGTAPGWLLGPWRSLGMGAAAGARGPLIFFIGLALAFVLYVAVFSAARGLAPAALVGAIVLCQLVFVLAPPLMSQDVFSYIAYARLGVEHGLNPYAHVPTEIAGDPVFAYVGWRHATSAYGPLFTLATYPLGTLSVPVAFWSLKILTGMASLGVLALVRRVAVALGRPPSSALAFVGLNPVVVVSVVGGAHNDVFAVLAGMAGTLAVVSRRSSVAGAFGAVATQVKSSLALTAGFLVLGARRRFAALLAAIAAIAVLTIVALAVFGGDVTGALTAAGENQERVSFYSIPNQTARLIAAMTGAASADLIDYVRAAFGLAFLILVVWLAWRALVNRDEWLRLAGWATFGLLIATAWLLPWYLVWLLPLVAVAGDRRLTIAALALTAYTLPIRVPL